MAKTTAPLLSFGASGQIAQTMVYSRWKGRAYSRRYTVPSNPQTAEQSLTRNAFSFLQAVYKFATPALIAPWEEYAKGIVMTGRNAFTKLNLANLRPETDLALMIFSPGALGGLPPASITVTGGADQLTVACTAPASVPTGWTLTSAILGTIPDQDPQSGALYAVQTFEDATAAYSNVFTCANGDHVGFAFLKWLRPDGRTAYSVSLSDIATVT